MRSLLYFETARSIASADFDLGAIFVSVLMSGAFVIVLMSLSLPVVMRTGMTRGVRFLPVVLVIAFVGAGFVFGEDGPLSGVGQALFGWMDALGPESAVWVYIAVFVTSLVVYAASALASMRLYAAREF